MFDAVVNAHRNTIGRRAMPLAISWAAHVLGIGAVAVPLLMASDGVPSLPDTITAFVVTAPAPPPPPAAAPVAPKVVTPRPPRADIRPPQVLQPRGLAAPVQPPAEDIAAVDEEDWSPVDGVAGGVEGGVPGGVLGGVVGSVLVDTPPPPPVPDVPIRTGGEIQAPALVKRVAPVYPPFAASAGVEGLVILEATVGRDGRVEEVTVLRSIKLLESAAIDAVRQWEYAPLFAKREARAIHSHRDCEFQLVVRDVSICRMANR
jgi:protein TonB